MAKQDLNLVRVLVALADAKHVSVAATRLGMTQPGVSNALRRMRIAYGDPLFVRTASGMEPTRRAGRLVSAARSILELYQREIIQTVGFSPHDSTEEIRFAMSDIGEMVFLPRILEHMRTHAPEAPFRSVSLPHDQLAPAMQDGVLDLAVGYFPDLKGAHFFQQKLFSHGFVCLVRSGHPCAGAALTKQLFAHLSHAVVQAEGRSQEVFEKFLRRMGLRRRIALHVPHFMSIPYVIAKSDLIVTVPLAVAAAFAERGDLKLLRPTFPLPRFSLMQHWHRGVHEDPRNKWLRAQIAAIFNPSTDEWRGRLPARRHND
jgi:DNA-binding transcriptional LysR family regulator